MKKSSELNNSMSTQMKRGIFFGLFFLFIIYTIVIAGPATEFTKGNEAITPQSQSGKLLFQKYNCIACHQVYGLGGYMGPDLTNVMSAEGKGPDFVKAILKHGSSRMPDFQLSESEISQLSDYLFYLDKTGVSPVREFTIQLNGTFSVPENEK